MPRGAPAAKLAITVDRDVHARILRAARQEHQSVSAWITNAARRALTIRAGLAAVTEWEEDQGALSPEELARARERLEQAGRRRQRARK